MKTKPELERAWQKGYADGREKRKPRPSAYKRTYYKAYSAGYQDRGRV